MYSGSMISGLIAAVEKTCGPIERTGDSYLDLANAKVALANKKMDAFDEVKWWQADALQQDVLKGPPCK
jgi:hypothetical protein